jgi:hypothetical protein
MAQTGYTPILIYSSSTASNAPAAGNLTNSTLGSELAINITDGKLFYKDNANAIQVIGWKTTPTTAGGTGLTSYTAGDMLYYASGTALSKLAIGAAGTWLGSSGTAPQWNSPAALTKTDDTNVTLTLGGSASTALLNAASLTLGWTGTLAVSRGGTGTATAFTAGSVVFAGASGVYSQNNSQLFWDNSNNRLGIGTNSPSQPCQVTWDFNGSTWHYVTNSNAGSGAAVGLLFATDQGGGASGAISQNSSGNSDKAVNALRIRNLLNAPIVFETNGTEGARLDSSQNLGVGITNPASYGKLAVGGSIGMTGAQINVYSGSDFELVERNAYKMNFYVNSASVMASLSITGVWTNASDARYKENIADSQYGLSTVMALKPRTYNLIGQEANPQIGFIAQEVLDIVPEVVESTFNSIVKEDRYTLSYGQLTAVLVKAMQEQQGMIDSLQSRLVALENK